jgi:flagellar hook-associated protein 3 FlgL
VPVAATGTMKAAGSLRALEQYRRNIQAAEVRVDAEEQAYSSLSDIIVRARELAVAQGSDTASANTRLAVKAEIDQLIGVAVQLANTKVAGSHLFGGTNASQPPVVWADPNAAPPEVVLDAVDPGHHRTEIAAGQFLVTAKNAHEVFTASGVFEDLWNLSAALGANDAQGIRDSIGELDGAFEHVQSMIGDIGARSARLQVTSSNLDALEITLVTFKSNLEEVDFEKAVTELISRQTTFQAAMLATSRVMGMTLTDYLR